MKGSTIIILSIQSLDDYEDTEKIIHEIIERTPERGFTSYFFSSENQHLTVNRRSLLQSEYFNDLGITHLDAIDNKVRKQKGLFDLLGFERVGTYYTVPEIQVGLAKLSQELRIF